MSCEICNRNSCSKSFHSLEEQEQFEDTIGVAIDNFKIGRAHV